LGARKPACTKISATKWVRRFHRLIEFSGRAQGAGGPQFRSYKRAAFRHPARGSCSTSCLFTDTTPGNIAAKLVTSGIQPQALQSAKLRQGFVKPASGNPHPAPHTETVSSTLAHEAKAGRV